MTPLDTAFAEMEAAPEDDALRLRYFERLADAELFMLLDEPAEADALSPKLFETSGGTFVLAFDREERLTAFTGGPSHYAALSGRAIAEALRGQPVGLGLNLGVAQSENLIPHDALSWLADTLKTTPEEAEARPETIQAPKGLPQKLLTSIDTKLATATGLARAAYLASATYTDGRPAHLLAFIDTVPGAEHALAKAMSEALVFSGVEAGVLDIAFFPATHPIAAPLAKHGLRFDLPQPDAPKSPTPPGRDPNKPPKLK